MIFLGFELDWFGRGWLVQSWGETFREFSFWQFGLGEGFLTGDLGGFVFFFFEQHLNPILEFHLILPLHILSRVTLSISNLGSILQIAFFTHLTGSPSILRTRIQRVIENLVVVEFFEWAISNRPGVLHDVVWVVWDVLDALGGRQRPPADGIGEIR